MSVTNIVHGLWKIYSGKLKLTPSVVDKWWNVVETRYSEPQRHYHTMKHIQHMCQLSEKYKQHLKDPLSIYYAIIFHDIVYDPKAPDNEEQSINVFEQFSAETNLKETMSQAVSDMILLTKSHSTKAHEQEDMYGDEDHHYFLDMDMAILGSPWKEYETYANQIREEYCHYPDEAYRNGRIQVLKNFLRTSNIFASKVMRDHYENQSRLNIQTEIENLGRC